ncbi:23445_t:CDS:2 [Gigaspora margarita]|uniref:23445_t:CDS:1 n=1 Tax=Gigaspora margarita TaxID=4874 RepID=A0ABN7UTE1_GIGMA|nr:23445_t:CDS:2 [Gigaspora margarita]
MSTNVTASQGLDAGSIEFSTSVALTVIVIANLFVCFNTYYWNWIVWARIINEIVIIFSYVLRKSNIWNRSTVNCAQASETQRERQNRLARESYARRRALLTGEQLEHQHAQQREAYRCHTNAESNEQSEY